MQLDIFDDSHNVMLRNDVLSALQRHDAPVARDALQILTHEYPDDAARTALDTLVTALGARCTSRFASHDAALGTRQTLLTHVHPSASELMGERGAIAWLAPARFATLFLRLQDSSLDTLRKAFDASFEGSDDVVDLAWFPAWALIQKTGLAPLLKQTQPGRDTEPERVARLVLRLLTLEREGRHHELVDSRRDLRDLHDPFYRLYMKTRYKHPHRWTFATRFRRNAFGWKSALPIQRLKEAVAEVRQATRVDAILAAEGAVLLLEKVSPAREQVDSSSGAIGTAVNRTIDALTPLSMAVKIRAFPAAS